MTPLPAGVLLDGDQNALADFAFQDFGLLLLAVRRLATGAIVGGDFYSSSISMR